MDSGNNLTTVSNFIPIMTIGNNNSLIDPFMYFKSKINEFINLPNNWDGYSAIPLFKEIGEKANQFIMLLSGIYIDKISDIFPNPNGTLTIDWENSKEEKASLEIGLNTYSYFVKYNSNPPKFINGENIIVDKEAFTQAISELFSEEFYPKFLS